MSSGIVYATICGIALEGLSELRLGKFTLIRNVAALRYGLTVAQSEPPSVPQRVIELLCAEPNAFVPDETVLENKPIWFRYHYEVREHGISNWLLEMEVDAPSRRLASGQLEVTFPAGFIEEELKWALLPLRVLTPSRIIAGLSPFWQGGMVTCAGIDGGLRQEIRRDGLLGSAPQPIGVFSIPMPFSIVPKEKSKAVSKLIGGLSEVVQHQRATLSQFQHTRIAIDNFSESFGMAFAAIRALTLLWALENLFCRPRQMRGHPQDVIKGAKPVVEKGMRQQTEHRVEQAYHLRKDVEHGRKSVAEVEKELSPYVEHLEDLVRRSLFRAITVLEAGSELSLHFPDPNKYFQQIVAPTPDDGC